MRPGEQPENEFQRVEEATDDGAMIDPNAPLCPTHHNQSHAIWRLGDKVRVLCVQEKPQQQRTSYARLCIMHESVALLYVLVEFRCVGTSNSPVYLG